MLDLVVAALKTVGLVELGIVCLFLSYPVLMGLKVVGEVLGSAASGLLKPLFWLPRWLRLVSLCLVASWACWAITAHKWAWILGLTQLPLALLFQSLTSDRYRSYNALVIFALLTVYVFSASINFAHQVCDGFWPQLYIFGMTIAGPSYFLRSLQRGYVTMEQQESQDRRNQRATALARRILAEEEQFEGFGLYLRGFVLDDRLGPPLANWAWEGGRFAGRSYPGGGGLTEAARVFDRETLGHLEEVLEHSTRRVGTVIAVGRWSGEFGFGRYATDEGSWQDVVARLMKRAAFIFVIPTNRPGTIWEIRHLVESGYLNKAIFIQPGPGGFRGASRGEYRTMQEEWEEARHALSDVVALPEYTAQPCFLMLGRDGHFQSAPGFWDSKRGIFSASKTRASLDSLIRCAGAQSSEGRWMKWSRVA